MPNLNVGLFSALMMCASVYTSASAVTLNSYTGFSPGYAIADSCAVTSSTSVGTWVTTNSVAYCKTVGTAAFKASGTWPIVAYCKECNSGYQLTEKTITGYTSCGTIRYTTCATTGSTCVSLLSCDSGSSAYCCPTGASVKTCPLGYTLGTDGRCGRSVMYSTDTKGYYKQTFGTCSPSSSVGCYVPSSNGTVYYADGSSSLCTSAS